MKRETFSSARARLLNSLAGLGWEVSSALKVPHARNPEGTIALFFKPQTVYVALLSTGQSASSAARESRSLWIDIRGMTIEALVWNANATKAEVSSISSAKDAP